MHAARERPWPAAHCKRTLAKRAGTPATVMKIAKELCRSRAQFSRTVLLKVLRTIRMRAPFPIIPEWRLLEDQNSRIVPDALFRGSGRLRCGRRRECRYLEAE